MACKVSLGYFDQSAVRKFNRRTMTVHFALDVHEEDGNMLVGLGDSLRIELSNITRCKNMRLSGRRKIIDNIMKSTHRDFRDKIRQ